LYSEVSSSSDGKINETIKYCVEFERMNLGDTDMDNIGASLLFGF
jgi:hypothetical protein